MNIVNEIFNTGWIFWLCVMLIILFFLWLFFGGGDYEYVGLSPLQIGVDSNRYVDNRTLAVVHNSNIGAPTIQGDNNIKDRSKFNNHQIEKSLGPYKPYNSKKISKAELICKEAIEEIYGAPFHCIRPNFLKNPETKRNLELDMYNHDLKLAVEYSGQQHYVWPNYTGQTKEQFINQVRRDKYKLECCDANGIYLITVPYTVPYHKIKDYLKYYIPENYKNRMNDNNPPNFEVSDDYSFEINELSDYQSDHQSDYCSEYLSEISDFDTTEISGMTEISDMSEISDDINEIMNNDLIVFA